jgi:hypothetical protein
MLSKIADAIMYVNAFADVVVAVLYLCDHHPWKSLYWLSAAAIVVAVTKMMG